ncbi:large conductance mechanosensitive channel protein MscL [Cryobacterium psychrophilum]|uniref:Large-conductance mechanosensitive channel n=1 Tax=Cryobacterium psychrophilum TaxID=41988 RepID=A0A4Y8KS70_9MICO|nr:large conductance mechanosensitive channel protein MscL [Cryobacterium psychrophilum]TDW29417.1 large conductance mechanosensitive channel [Cryobacterium psychrophilum]TFD81440.1 large conductance mechanosensitive channel protein MscL [Cryobacterium psychrophilum]
MFKGFKEFIMRGNVIDLAVAVVIGAAFTAVVTALVTNIFNPLIAAIFNVETLSTAMTIPLRSGENPPVLALGAVLAALINFVLIAAVVYFVFVLPINRLKKAQARRRDEGVPAAVVDDPTTELDMLTEIRDLLAKNAIAPAQGTPALSTKH